MHTSTLPFAQTQTQALLLIPPRPLDLGAILTHGYTAHKAQLLPWAQTLFHASIPTVIFDLPGHGLGHFCPVHHFEEFADGAHTLFAHAHQALAAHLSSPPKNLILGGHSLGALLSLKALDHFLDSGPRTVNFCVGLGLDPEKKAHPYGGNFFKKTLHERRLLVAKALDPDVVFPWIKREKEGLKIRGQTIYLLSGEDDIIATPEGAKNLKKHLEKEGNTVTLHTPRHLPHHEPQRAKHYVKKFLLDLSLL